MIAHTTDMDGVNRVLSHPEIWPLIADDVPVFDIPMLAGHVWYRVNDFDGVIMFHGFRDGVKIHPNFPPEKRGKLAYDAIDEAVLEVFRQGIRSVYCEIDRNLVHITRCARHLGFSLVESGDRDLFVRRRLDS